MSFWSILFLAGLLRVIPQPASIIGYLWTVELALAGLLLLTLGTAANFSNNRYSLRKIETAEIRRIILPLIFFVAWSGLSCFWAESRRGALHHTLLWACYVLFYFLIRQIVSRPRLLDVSLKFTGCVLTVLAAACIVEYSTVSADALPYFTFRYYKYAEIFAALLPVFFASALQSKKADVKLPGLLLVVSLWLSILMSLSRTEFIAGIVGIALFSAFILLSSNRKIYFKKLTVFLFVFVLAAFSTQISNSKDNENSTLNRFGGNRLSSVSSSSRLLFWGVALEAFRQNPVLGVGADNYVTVYKTARENFSRGDAENKLLEINENVLAERAHNEFLQILSELGAVGAFIFAWFLFGAAKTAFAACAKSKSLTAFGAVAGMLAFFISSFASSYSFRLPANGVCFFFLLALAVNYAQKAENGGENQEKFSIALDSRTVKTAFTAVALIICFGTLVFSVVRGGSLMRLQTALTASDQRDAEENYRRAIALDGEDGLFRYYYGINLYNRYHAGEAIPQMRFAVDKGIATSISFFYLASAQIGAEQTAEAEKTMRESLRVYPRSIFLRTFYAFLLEKNGKNADSQAEYGKALLVDAGQARSWRIAFNDGTSSLNRLEHADPDLVGVMDLQPTDGVYALLDFQRQNDSNLLRR